MMKDDWTTKVKADIPYRHDKVVLNAVFEVPELTGIEHGRLTSFTMYQQLIQ